MIRILFDYQVFTIQRFGGSSRYFIELYKGMKKDKDIKNSLGIILSNNNYLLGINNNPFLNRISKIQFRGLNKIYKYLNKYYMIILLKQGNYDIFHPTYFDPYFLKYLGKKPFVLTVHDMTHELYPYYKENNKELIANKKLLIEKASSIIAVSNNTKNDIIKIYDVDKNKIKVIYHGIEYNKNHLSISPIILPDKYILFVGRRGLYKNFNFVLEEFKKINTKFSDIYLVCLGGGPFNSDEITQISKLSIANKVKQYDAEEIYLDLYYKNAIAFIFPSLYEGFGIPLLESMKNNCPLLLSDIECFKEIAGDAAIYFNPNVDGTIFTALENLLNDKILRMSLIEKGKKLIRNFSWESTIKQTKELYLNTYTKNQHKKVE